MTTSAKAARRIVLGAAILGLTGVMAGTFGAHGLKDRLSPELLSIFETGVRYHLLHALAMLGIAALIARAPGAEIFSTRWLGRAAAAMALGIVIFSGSLYALAISGERWLGMITPLGGGLMLIGWLCLAIAAIRQPPLRHPPRQVSPPASA